QQEAGRHDVRRRAVAIATDPSIQRFADARAHLKVLLKAFPDDGELARLMGQCCEVDDKHLEAEEQYGRAVKLAPADVEGYVRLAYLQRRRLSRAKEADKCMDLLIEKCKTAPAYLARYHYRKELK